MIYYILSWHFCYVFCSWSKLLFSVHETLQLNCFLWPCVYREMMKSKGIWCQLPNTRHERMSFLRATHHYVIKCQRQGSKRSMKSRWNVGKLLTQRKGGQEDVRKEGHEKKRWRNKERDITKKPPVSTQVWYYKLHKDKMYCNAVALDHIKFIYYKLIF